MRSNKIHLSSTLLPLAAVLVVLSSSACSLPSLSFREPVWIIGLPVTFTGRFNVVEHHTSAGKRITCSSDTTGTLTVDSKGGVTFTTQGGVFTISTDGQVTTEREFPCIEQGKDQGWQGEG